MIRINLLPLKETQRALGQRQQISVALLTLSVALLFMVVPYVMQGRQLSHLDEQIGQLQKEIQALTEQTREARDLDQKKQEHNQAHDNRVVSSEFQVHLFLQSGYRSAPL